MVGEREFVTYRELAEYVSTQIAPLKKSADEHDAWHRGRLEAELALARKARALFVTQICSVAAVVVSVVEIIANHH